MIALPGRAAAHHLALAAQLRRRRVLAVSEGRRVVGLTNVGAPWRAVTLEARAVVAEAPPAVRDERGRALEELRAVIEVAIARGHAGQVSAQDYLPELLLRRSPQLATQICRRVYGPLTEELAHTLDLLVTHSFERAPTAAALPVHRNTLRDRIARISEMTGVDLDGAEGRAMAWLAWLQRRDSTSGSAA